MDVIINQAQIILSKDFIEVPRVGCLNRHAALLPSTGKAGTLWAYLNGEKESGLSIHFIDEKLITVQSLSKRVPTRMGYCRYTVDRIFLKVAPDAMLEALELIRSDCYEDYLTDNDASKASAFPPWSKRRFPLSPLGFERWIIESNIMISVIWMNGINADGYRISNAYWPDTSPCSKLL